MGVSGCDTKRIGADFKSIKRGTEFLYGTDKRETDLFKSIVFSGSEVQKERHTLLHNFERQSNV